MKNYYSQSVVDVVAISTTSTSALSIFSPLRCCVWEYAKTQALISLSRMAGGCGSILGCLKAFRVIAANILSYQTTGRR